MNAVAFAALLLLAGAAPSDETRAYQEIRAFAKKIAPLETAAPADVARYRAMLLDFVHRPHHENEPMLGGVFLSLFRLEAADPSTPPAELLESIRGMDRYERGNPHVRFAMAAEALADRGLELAYAEDLARRGIPIMARELEESKADYGSDYERNAKYFNAQMHDALGWVLVREGKRREGTRELDAAYRLNNDDPHVLYHLGRVAEEAKDPAAARRWYERGAVVQTSRTNPNLEALRRLVPSESAFNDDLANLRAGNAAERRRRIVRSRLSPSRAVRPFRLETLDGRTLSLDAFRGRVTVINFWGVWCTWCLRELPDFVELRRRYAAAADVAIVTINNDHDAQKVRRWMAEKQYDFPVILDQADYVHAAGITTFPTTWFLDKNGRLAFEKVGWSEKLLEEFAWRIDELRR